MSVEQRFEERVTTRGLTDTLAQLSPRRTISPQALREAGMNAALFDDVVPTATANLPRIVLEHRSASGDVSKESTSAADFEVIGLLGEGGMGRVLLARQHSLAREVAIKTLKENDDSAVFTSGLLREGRITGALEHPGIVPVHALGLNDSGFPLLVMKRIEGVSFRALLDDATHSIWDNFAAGAANRLETSIEILMRVCQSLAFAHSRGILHRDIKPENILVGDYGETYLCDWGVATRIDDVDSTSDMLVGTPHYMAPEMLLGDAIDARTDVYLLGATLHEVLTGRPRHDGASMHEILHSVAISAPFEYEPSIAPELGRLCNRSTSSDPALRPVSVDAFRKELAEYMRQRSAMVLCAAAFERLHALDALLQAGPTTSVPKDLVAAYRHATEARFGFAQSLRVHSQLDAAKQGLERTLVAMFDMELRQQHVESAEALLDELTEPSPQLVNRLSAARKEAEAQRLETDRLRAIARDLDPKVAARSRMLVLGATSVCGLVLGLGIFLKTEQTRLTPPDLVAFATILVVSLCIVLVIMRRRVGETLFNRRMAAILICVASFLLLNRLVAWRAGETVSQILIGDTVLLFAVFTTCTVTFERRLVALALVVGLGLVAMMMRPESILLYFQIMTLAMLPTTVWVWRAPRDPG